MSDTTTDTTVDTGPEVTATETEESTQPKPTETVDFWKQKAREQEARAKSNAAAAKKLADLEDASKTDAERAAERIAKAEAEVASVPAKVAEALKSHLMALHNIDAEDAELFLTATDPEVLIKQVSRLVFQTDGKRRSKSNVVPNEGKNPQAATDDMREFTRGLFGDS